MHHPFDRGISSYLLRNFPDEILSKFTRISDDNHVLLFHRLTVILTATDRFSVEIRIQTRALLDSSFAARSRDSLSDERSMFFAWLPALSDRDKQPRCANTTNLDCYKCNGMR
jgi:hypothetical protein